MIPDKPFEFNNSEGELQVFDALKKLTDNIYVFHSLRWIGNKESSAIQGEGDFVIFDPKNGLLVIEVKSGLIRYENRRWFQTNRATKIEKEMQDPESQASRTKFQLLERIKKYEPNFLICHAVWFPSGNFDKNNLPLNYDKEIILDINDLENPTFSIENIYKFWSQKIMKSNLSKNGVKNILDIIAPTFKIVPTLRFEFEKREKQFIQLTSEQYRLLDYLEEQEFVTISGIAGSGKTIVAIEKARRLSEEGNNVLFLSYNSALRNFLKESYKIPRVDFHTFHSLSKKYITTNTNSINDLPKLFIDKILNDDFIFNYDSIIIDEGQDFENDWLEALKMKIKGSFYIFYDNNQLIFQNELPNLLKNSECRLVLKKNCRSTFQIFRTSHRFAGILLSKDTNRVIGENVVLYESKTFDNEIEIIKNIIKKIIVDKELKYSDIAILTMENIETFNSKKLNNFDNINFSDSIKLDNICFTTVRKFKGLEAKIVILIDVDPKKLIDIKYRKRMYVGCSRAMHETHILINDCSNDSFNIAISSMKKNTKIKGNKKSFADFLDAKWFEK